MYVTTETGERNILLHPGEDYDIARVFNITSEEIFEARFREPGFFWSKQRRKRREAILQLLAARTGFLSDTICKNCLHQFRLDFEKDAHRCPECSSSKIQEVANMVGAKCPKCTVGQIQRIDTGIIS